MRVAWLRSVAPGGSTTTERREGMYGEWNGGRKQNKDRCQRAVVMPELIHSAARPLPASKQRERERVGGDVQEMDPLGNDPVLPAVLVIDR